MRYATWVKNSSIEISRALERLIPNKISAKWAVSHLGLSNINYDMDSIQNFFILPTWEFLKRGGKRWRPLLMILACEVVGGKSKQVRSLAVIPELIHSGTLILDDIEDNSMIRRNKPTMHVLYGIDIALNLGGMLGYLPLHIISKTNLEDLVKLRIFQLINEEMLKIHVGQGTDIFWSKHPRLGLSEHHYLAMCEKKTGALARIAAGIGAIIGNGTEAQIKALEKFAERIGIGFQIRDDVLNIRGSVGKQKGEDISGGKMTLPVIRTLEISNREDKAELLKILREHSDTKIKQAISIMKKYDSLNYSMEIAKKIITKAWVELEPNLGESSAKTKLKQFAKDAATRTS